MFDHVTQKSISQETRRPQEKFYKVLSMTLQNYIAIVRFPNTLLTQTRVLTNVG